MTSAIVARQFTREEFGLWSMLQAIYLLATNFDLGLKYGMGNRLAAISADGNESEYSEVEVYFAVFNALSVFAILAAALLAILGLYVPWPRYLIGLDEMGARPILVPVTISILVVILNLPFGLASVVFFAKQEIGISSGLTVLTSILLLLIVWGSSRWWDLKIVIYSYFIGNLLISVLGTLFLWKKRRWNWEWTSSRKQYQAIRGFVGPSLKFFVLNILSLATISLGTLVTGSVSGLTVAGNFAIFQRLFNTLNTVHLAILAPIGPEYTSWASDGRWEKILNRHNSILRRLWPLIFLGAGGAVCSFHSAILGFWTGIQVSDYRLAALFWLWAALQGWINSCSVLLNSLGVVGFQSIYVLCMFLPSAITPVVFSNSFGVHGVILGNVICLLPGVLIWTLITRNAIARRVCFV